jgi:hypothetical protein
LSAKETADQDRATILQLYLEFDARRAKDLAPRYLTAKSESLRLAAALIVFTTGDKAKARDALGDSLERDEFDKWVCEAVTALLADGTPESRKQAVRLFANPHLNGTGSDGWRWRVLAISAKAGLKEPYRFYTKALEDESDPAGAEDLVREITLSFAPDDPAVKQIVKAFPNRKDQVAPLKKWLLAKLEQKD